MKKTYKIMLFFLVLFFVNILHTTSVNAFTTDDVILDNELQSNMLYIDEAQNISIRGSEFIKLLSNPNKLNKLLQSDNRVYDNVYIKVDKNTVRVTEISNNLKKDLDIVEKNGEKYTKCPIAVAIKYNGVFYPASLEVSGINIFDNKVELEIQDSSNIVSKKAFNISIFEGDNSFNSAITDFNSIIQKKDNFFGGEGSNFIEYISCETSMAKGDCYVTVSLNVYAGENLELEPFGVLNYVGKGDGNYGRLNYEYKAVITNKNILKNRIIARIVNAKYNVLHFAVIDFSGNSVEIPESLIDKVDNESKVKLVASSNTVPYNTKLEVKSIVEGSEYNLVYSTLGTTLKNMRIYDIKLTSNNIKFQPNGTVKIKIPILNNMDISNLKIYRITSNREKIEYSYEIEVINNIKYATIQTDHFSIYVIGEKNLNTVDNSDNTSNADNKDSTNEDIINNNDTKSQNSTEKNNRQHVLDNEPKTGIDMLNFLIIGLVTTIGSVISKCII